MAIDLTPIWISLKTVLAATAITFFLGIAAAHCSGMEEAGMGTARQSV